MFKMLNPANKAPTPFCSLNKEIYSLFLIDCKTEKAVDVLARTARLEDPACGTSLSGILVCCLISGFCASIFVLGIFTAFNPTKEAATIGIGKAKAKLQSIPKTAVEIHGKAKEDIIPIERLNST